MSEIPDELMMHAERLYDEGGYKPVPTIIAEAILAERERRREVATELADGGWQTVPDEMTTELIAATTKGRQVLAYEQGRYYNAWMEFDEYEGGWLWFDEADSEPSPSHYRPLPSPPHTFTPDQTETLNERHEAGERA